MSDELKPCPFCGGKAYIHEHYTFGGYVPTDYPHNEPLGYAIGCCKYDCRGKRENTGFMYDTEAEAIAAWNTRADDAPEQIVESGEADSREQLQVDAWKFVERWAFDDDDISRPITHLNCSKELHELLDRQAAITQAECERICDTCEWPSLAAQPDQEAYDRIDELTAERDQLKAELETYGKVSDQRKCDNYGTVENKTSQVPGLDADRTCPNLIGQASIDTREQLEADLREFFEGIRYGFETAVKWLDRQAAITERELCGRCSPYATAKDYLDTIDSLTAERDQLQEQHGRQAKTIERLTAERELYRDNMQFQAGRVADVTAERDMRRVECDKLRAECDRLREKLRWSGDMNDKLRDKLREKQRVCDVQRDSFLKLERENRELQDVCGELERTLENLRGME